jgi:hypothetical protein
MDLPEFCRFQFFGKAPEGRNALESRPPRNLDTMNSSGTLNIQNSTGHTFSFP